VGAVLLIVMFLPWYGVDAEFANVSVSESANAWEMLSFIDILLFLIAVIAIAVPLARSSGVLAAGALGLLLVLFRIVDIPAPDLPALAEDSIDFERKIGLFFGLVATAGIVYGGWRANMKRPGGPPAVAAPPPQAPVAR
jgi:predicted MFS family arabinose efflux permease